MRTHKLLIPILILIFLFLGSTEVDAQRRRKKKRKKRPTKTEQVQKDEDVLPLKDRLWYGVNANIGLSNYFFLGLNPMVGYKFNKWLSAGPELILDYVQFKQLLGNEYKNIKVLDYGIGAFTRAKILEGPFFVQLEYTLTNKGQAVLDPSDPNDYYIDRKLSSGAYIGVGYTASSAYNWGYMGTLLYNLNDDPQSSSLPISIKVGLAYNF